MTFMMEPDTGVLRLSNKRRQGMKLSYQLNVSVSDGVFTSTAQVRQLLAVTYSFCQLIWSFFKSQQSLYTENGLTFFTGLSKLLPTFAAAQCNCCFSQLPAPQWEVNVSPYQIYFEDKLPAGKNTHICLLVVITNGRFEGGLGHISHISVAITHHPILKVLLLTCMKYVCSSSSRRCQYLCVIRV